MTTRVHWDAAGKSFRLEDGTTVGYVMGNHLDEVTLDLDHLRDTTMSSLQAAITVAQHDLPGTRQVKAALPGPIMHHSELTNWTRWRAIEDACRTFAFVSPSDNRPLSTMCLDFAVTGSVYANISVADPLKADKETAVRVFDALAVAKGYTLEHLSQTPPDGPTEGHFNLLLRINEANVTLGDIEKFQDTATELFRLPRPDMFALGGPTHLKWDIARRMLLYGHSAYLVGQPEASWLEVKSRGYDCDDLAQQIELAKDVARFANGDGPGLLVLGYRTKRSNGQDVIQKHCPLPIDQATCERYRAIIDKRVFPPIRGLSVDRVQHDKGVSVVITVPEQEDHERPFLVHGAMIDGRHEGAFISIVRRRGEQSIPVSPAAIHAALAAGRRVLRGGLDLQ